MELRGHLKEEEELKPLHHHWQLARDRFDLALKERRSLQEKSATLERRIQSQREELKRLLDQAHGLAETLTERIETTKKSIDLEQKLRDTARHKIDLARQTRRILEAQLRSALEADRPPLRDEIGAPLFVGDASAVGRAGGVVLRRQIGVDLGDFVAAGTEVGLKLAQEGL